MLRGAAHDHVDGVPFWRMRPLTTLSCSDLIWPDSHCPDCPISCLYAAGPMATCHPLVGSPPWPTRRWCGLEVARPGSRTAAGGWVPVMSTMDMRGANLVLGGPTRGCGVVRHLACCGSMQQPLYA